MADNEQFRISEKDIGVALRYLKYHDPENATRDRAIAMLKDLNSGFHRMAHDDPDRLLELQRKVEGQKAP